MKYSEKEKLIASDFIKCAIPECIKWNEFETDIDTMECYEALFDFAYSIIDDLKMSSHFSCSIENGEFLDLIMFMKSNGQEECFCDNVIALFSVIERYK